jgi:transcriptional antiterminator RfaH
MYQNLDKKWFIVQIKPNSHNTAIQNLERQGFETFLPQMEVTQRKENKFRVKNVYVFPGYIFVCFDPRVITWTKINNTYGVLKLLAFNGRPSEISSDLILELKNRYEINSNSTQKEKLEKGDAIKFLAGPFTELIGKIENVDDNNRIWVLLDVIGGYKKLKLKNVEQNKYRKL